MAKNRLRWVLIGLVVFVIGAGIGKFAMPGADEKNTPSSSSTAAKDAPKSTNGACDEQNPGVTLVVDFGTKSDKKPIEKCVTGFSGNGWQLFAAAGLKIEGTSKYPTGFACRIESMPADQDCGDKASFDKGYWSYFYLDAAKPKGWNLSEAGAADRSPKAGDFEGWVWTATGETNKVPAIAPAVPKFTLSN